MLSEFFNKASTEGLKLPYAHDAATGKASVTLLFVYLTNLLSIISLIVLHFRSDPAIASTATCIFSIVWVVLYMMRSLHKAKFDLDDKSFELESGEEEDETSKTSS